MRKELFYRTTAVICAFIFTTTIALAQTKTVTGVVNDEAGKPLAGATVSQVGGTAAAITITDKDGSFKSGSCCQYENTDDFLRGYGNHWK